MIKIYVIVASRFEIILYGHWKRLGKRRTFSSAKSATPCCTLPMIFSSSLSWVCVLNELAIPAKIQILYNLHRSSGYHIGITGRFTALHVSENQPFSKPSPAARGSPHKFIISLPHPQYLLKLWIEVLKVSKIYGTFHGIAT